MPRGLETRVPCATGKGLYCSTVLLVLLASPTTVAGQQVADLAFSPSVSAPAFAAGESTTGGSFSDTLPGDAGFLSIAEELVRAVRAVFNGRQNTGVCFTYRNGARVVFVAVGRLQTLKAQVILFIAVGRTLARRPAFGAFAALTDFETIAEHVVRTRREIGDDVVEAGSVRAGVRGAGVEVVAVRVLLTLGTGRQGD